MRKIYPHLGLALVCMGVIIFLICYLGAFTDSNLPLFLGLACVVIGAVIHVYWQKKLSNY